MAKIKHSDIIQPGNPFDDTIKGIKEVEAAYKSLEKTVGKGTLKKVSEGKKAVAKSTKELTVAEKEQLRVEKAIAREQAKQAPEAVKRQKLLDEERLKTKELVKGKKSLGKSLFALKQRTVLYTAAIIGAVKALQNMTKTLIENNKLQNKIKRQFDVNAAAAKNMAGQVRFLARQMEQTNENVLNAANAFSKEFTISGKKALDLIEKGFRQGANDSGEFLDILKEYPAQLKRVGLDADQTIRLISKQVKEGIFSDKGIDAIKEGGLRLGEMTTATRDAIDGIGLSSETIIKQLETGEKTFFEVMQQISKQLKTLPPQSAKVGTAIADIFGGPGEDAGLRFLTTLGDINTEMEDMNTEADDFQEALFDLDKSWETTKQNLLSGAGAFSDILTGIITKLTAISESIRMTNIHSQKLKEVAGVDFWKDGLLRPGVIKELGNVSIKLDELVGNINELSDDDIIRSMDILEVAVMDLDQSTFRGEATAKLYKDAIKQLSLALNKNEEAVESVTDKQKTLNDTLKGASGTIGLINKLNEEIKETSKLMGSAETLDDITRYQKRIESLKKELIELKKPLEEIQTQIVQSGGVTPVQDAQLAGNIPTGPTTTGADSGPFGGFVLSEGDLQNLKTTGESLIDLGWTLTDAQIAQAEARISMHDKELDSLQSKLEKEMQDKENGDAANIQRIQRQINAEEKLRKEAIEKSKKAQKTQLAIDTVTQGSNLITAASNIYAATAKDPITTALATVTVGAMIAAFAASKITAYNAIEAQQFADGTESVQLNGAKDGIDTVPAWLTKGEGVMKVETNMERLKLGVKMDDVPAYIKKGLMYDNISSDGFSQHVIYNMMVDRLINEQKETTGAVKEQTHFHKKRMSVLTDAAGNKYEVSGDGKTINIIS